MAKETDRLISRAGADTGDAYGHIDEKHHEKFKDAASSKERTISPLSPLKFLESTSPHKRGSPPPLHALDPRPPTTQRGRFLLFSTLFMISALLNFDNGAIASSLIPITQEFKLSFSQQGFLGSLVYLGLTISSLFAGKALHLSIENSV